MYLNISVYNPHGGFLFNLQATNMGKLHHLFTIKMASAMNVPDFYISDVRFAYTSKGVFVGVCFVVDGLVHLTALIEQTEPTAPPTKLGISSDANGKWIMSRSIKSSK